MAVVLDSAEQREDWRPPYRLYIVEFTDGLLKAGISAHPGLGRIRSLARRGPILQYYMSEGYVPGFSIEYELCQRIARVATVVRGREWFTGISFAAAKQLLVQIVAEHKPAITQADERGIEGADERVDSLLSHGKKFTAQPTFNHRQVA